MFVKSAPLMIGHMQEDRDQIRGAAERYEGPIASSLVAAWNAPGAADGHFEPPNLAHDLLQCRGEAANLMLDQIGQEIGQKIGQKIGHVRKDLRVTFGFGGPAAFTNEQAAANAAQFVREIGNDTRTTLNAILSQGIAAGLPPAATARTLRESVGLTIAQAAAVQNYRRLLESGNIEALRRALRDKRFDVAPAQLVNLTTDQIDQRVDAYRQRYLGYRATTIARYETLAAANGGAVNSIVNSVASGALPPTTRIRWMIAHDERTCPRCRSIVDLQPSGVQIGQPFHWAYNGRSGEIMFAPLHTDCRCTTTFRVMR
jgi:hypothetical protein